MTKAFARAYEIGAGAPNPVPNETWKTIATLTLPAGSYVVTASLYMTNESDSPGIAATMVSVGDQNAQLYDTIAAQSAVSQTPSSAGALQSAGEVTLSCTNNSPQGDLAVQTYNMTAIEVSRLELHT